VLAGPCGVFRVVLDDLDDPAVPNVCLMAGSLSADVLGADELRYYVVSEMSGLQTMLTRCARRGKGGGPAGAGRRRNCGAADRHVLAGPVPDSLASPRGLVLERSARRVRRTHRAALRPASTCLTSTVGPNDTRGGVARRGRSRCTPGHPGRHRATGPGKQTDSRPETRPSTISNQTSKVLND
jgi:hypothetical protein